MSGDQVECPICGAKVAQNIINRHIDSDCTFTGSPLSPNPQVKANDEPDAGRKSESRMVSGFFSAQSKKRAATQVPAVAANTSPADNTNDRAKVTDSEPLSLRDSPPPAKKAKRSAAEEAMPLAERMRPKYLNELIGHEDLVGPQGVLRELILSDRVPSMILWAGPGVSYHTARAHRRLVRRHSLE